MVWAARAAQIIEDLQCQGDPGSRRPDRTTRTPAADDLDNFAETVA
jgi:hypothetical protein